MFEDFTEHALSIGPSRIAWVQAGSGPPILLLHGFPQTRAAWHRVAPWLAKLFTVVVPDLPGYGDSSGPAPDPAHLRYSKRETAGTLVQLMHARGFERFAVVGHDRGGRVAYRMALDAPERISRLAVLDVVPTLEMAEAMTHELAVRMANWFLLAQPSPFPETLIGDAPEVYLDYLLESWAGTAGAIAHAARAEYARAFRNRSVVRAACEDYRAGASVDLQHDRADRDAERRISCPVLALWSAKGITGKFFDPLPVWRRWAAAVEGEAVDCGHFLMEEAPDEIASALERFLLTEKRRSK